MLRLVFFFFSVSVLGCTDDQSVNGDNQQLVDKKSKNTRVKPIVEIKTKPITPQSKSNAKAIPAIKPIPVEVKPVQQSYFYEGDYEEFDANDETDQEIIYYLEQLKNSTDPITQIKAIENIDDADEPRVLQHLQEALSDPEPSVRIAILKQLTGIELYSAVTSVVASLNDPDADVVIIAIDAIEEIADESLVAKLKPLLQHPDDRVQKRAKEAIAMIK